MLRVNNLVGFGAGRSGGGGSAHRYWRLLIKGNYATNVIAIAEIEMRETIGGSDVTSGKTFSASSVLSSPTYDPDNAFADDGSTTFYHSQSPASYDEWIQVDFGAGDPKDINEVTFQPRSSFPDQGAIRAHVQYSDNGSAWTTKFSIFRWNTTSTTTHRYRNGNQYIWFETTSVGGGFESFSEMELRDAVSGTDQLAGLGEERITVNRSPSETVSRWFDNNTGTRMYFTFSNPTNVYIDADTDLIFAELALTSDSFGTDTTRAGTIYSSSDGENWTSEISISVGSAWGTVETKLFT